MYLQINRCCRNIPYDITTDTCDQNGLVRPTEEVHQYPSVCGDEPYHPDDHACCNGNVLVGHGQTCCFGFVFNTSTVGINTGECCGGYAGYNPDSQICCGVQVYPKVNPGKTV